MPTPGMHGSCVALARPGLEVRCPCPMLVAHIKLRTAHSRLYVAHRVRHSVTCSQIGLDMALDVCILVGMRGLETHLVQRLTSAM